MADLKLGIDIGSTTIKAVLMDGGRIIEKVYRRHHSDIENELEAFLVKIAQAYPDDKMTVGIAGSAGFMAAEAMEVPFVQEVIAETEAVRLSMPESDVIIELGGEDAKITFLHPVPEQRMNGSCAGGTGSFIDQMSGLLKTDATGLDGLAAQATTIYPIASRCGVFAKSDLQILINEGAKREDLAASVFHAVVNQTVAGLACGRKIEGNVVFLGGPLTFLPQLRKAFEKQLKFAYRFTLPEDSELFVAIGAALNENQLEKRVPATARELLNRWQRADKHPGETETLPPLFKDEKERAAFVARHEKEKADILLLANQAGPLFLGVDAGSTTTKAALINQAGAVVYSHYASNEGSPVPGALSVLKEICGLMPKNAYIARACVTGYGENLIRTAFSLDDGEIETMAHYMAARAFCPEVNCVIDIGGQDMKCIMIKDGAIDQIVLNEACSSGCGSFLQTFAQTLAMNVSDFAVEALNAAYPVDLGTRCTVFMNSKVKQAQKEGATVADLSAGLSYSVVRNALYKVIKLRDPKQLGSHVVVQGGTFLNDAVLRCFEIVSGAQVVRPNIAGLMGAYGAALMAKEKWDGKSASTLVDLQTLEAFTMETQNARCRRCENKCRLTISTFADGRRLISGNRCERGSDAPASEKKLPNLFAYKHERVFGYQSLQRETAPRGVIGIPRALNMYEDYPLWHTVLTELGFSVVLSGESNRKIFEKGMHTISSESVCYPAKLAHGHVMDLIEKGITTIFYPCIPYEQKENPGSDNHFNCPIVTSYPEVIRNNMEEVRGADVRFIVPFLGLDHKKKLASELAKALAFAGVTEKETGLAVKKGLAELNRFHEDMRIKGDETLALLEKTGARGIVLAGRPYHIDPEINHGIPQMINELGLAVLTEDSVAMPGTLERPIRVRDQWMYHTRLYEAAGRIAAIDRVELTQLTSFGCGLDAITCDQVQEILAAAGRTYTLLKIDEVNNLGAARIRMRSLLAVMNAQGKAVPQAEKTVLKRPVFTREMKKTHILIGPQMAPAQFKLLEGVFKCQGYEMKILLEATKRDIETGLKYVNNDACYPAIMVIGQMMNALLSGQYDVHNTSLLLTQTGGGCRATNYVALLRKALKDAGLDFVPVIAISMTNIETNPGLHYTPKLISRALKAIILGDLISALTLRVRPYEKAPGAADALYDRCLNELSGLLAGPGIPIEKAARDIIRSYEAFDFDRDARKPLVGVVGEILVKFHPDANNQVVRVIENEGCEAVLPGLLGFFLYGMSGSMWRYKHLGSRLPGAVASQTGAAMIEKYEHKVLNLLKESSLNVFVPMPIMALREKASEVLSLGNVCGEGWFLTGEMIELIEYGAVNIICAQPFACLPNHVTGKGMMSELRRRYPAANIVAVDYDPGASEVNQLNRIKLMLTTAKAPLNMEYGAVETVTEAAIAY